jgi:hypothetical protein
MGKNSQFSPSGARLTVAAFFAVLWVVFAGTWLGWGQFTPADEARIFSPWPHLGANFLNSLNLYIHDHFGFRGWFITLNAFLRAKVAHTSTSHMVLMGRNGFMFYTGDDALKSYMRTNPMPDCELESWVQLFERRSAWLAQRDIPLIVAIGPDKQSIYPEMMPGSIPHPQVPSRADRLIEALRTRTQVRVVDFRRELLAEKRTRTTFHLTDTHWNDWGAYVAYRQLIGEMKAAAPRLASRIGRPLELSELREADGTLASDLNRLLGLGFAWVGGEKIVSYTPLHQTDLLVALDLIVGGTGNTAQPRLVIFRDSFADALAPFLAGHFSWIYGPRTWIMDPKVVTDERPDLVFIDVVERRLNSAPPIDPDNALEVRPQGGAVPKVWGIIDEPANGQNLSGAGLRMSGWALANQPNSIQKVEVLVDGKSLSEMKIHIPHPGVAQFQPGMRDSASAGTELIWDSRQLENGLHRMVWKATDTTGYTVEIGKRQFCVAN